MTFKLHTNLEKKIFLLDLPLCTVLMEDEKHYPWLFLVPRKKDIQKIIDLSMDDQILLLKELDFVQKVLWQEFNPTQLNVAAIGNKTPQLHIHVIVRYENDPAWPHTVWDHKAKAPLDEPLKKSRIDKLRSLLSVTKK